MKCNNNHQDLHRVVLFHLQVPNTDSNATGMEAEAAAGQAQGDEEPSWIEAGKKPASCNSVISSRGSRDERRAAAAFVQPPVWLCGQTRLAREAGQFECVTKQHLRWCSSH